MKILAIDPGTKMGWATRGYSGVNDLGKGVNCRDACSRHGLKFAGCGSMLEFLIYSHTPDMIALEDLVGDYKGEAKRMMPGYRAVILLTAANKGVPVVPVPIQTWQLWANRHGRSVKSDINDAVWLYTYAAVNKIRP